MFQRLNHRSSPKKSPKRVASSSRTATAAATAASSVLTAADVEGSREIFEFCLCVIS